MEAENVSLPLRCATFMLSWLDSNIISPGLSSAYIWADLDCLAGAGASAHVSHRRMVVLVLLRLSRNPQK